ncbi:MAG: nucleotide exchange factor GrpE [Gammaproteobacteria bacterium]|nr:nucleotide exchange factor GrpE [Gammaproteobacteria bacterium]
MSKKNWQKIKEDHEQEAVDKEVSEDVRDMEDELEEGAQPSTDFTTMSREALEAELIQAKADAQTNLAKALSALADMDNLRKRTERDVLAARLYGQEKLIQSMLPVLDSLEQALVIINKETHGEVGEGVELTLKLLSSALEKHDVVEINPEGLPFNPQEHEAMSIQPSDAVPPNTVLTVFQKGYKLNDRVIRAAKVIVSKAPG